MPVDEIRRHAETVRLLLSQQGEMTLRELGELTHLSGTMIALALGWLAGEGKIQILSNNGIFRFSLKEKEHEQYY